MTYVLESDGIDLEIAKYWVQSFEGDLTRRMVMPPPPSQDKELREKALMYAMQRASHRYENAPVLDIAEQYLVFLKGDAA